MRWDGDAAAAGVGEGPQPTNVAGSVPGAVVMVVGGDAMSSSEMGCAAPPVASIRGCCSQSVRSCHVCPGTEDEATTSRSRLAHR